METLPKWGSIFTVEADITVTKIVEGTVETIVLQPDKLFVS